MPAKDLFQTKSHRPETLSSFRLFAEQDTHYVARPGGWGVGSVAARSKRGPFQRSLSFSTAGPSS